MSSPASRPRTEVHMTHTLHLYLTAMAILPTKIDIDFPMDDLLSGIAAAEGGQFWVYGTHNLMAYTKGGEFAGHIADYEMDLCTPTVIGGRLYIQALDYRSQFPGHLYCRCFFRFIDQSFRHT